MTSTVDIEKKLDYLLSGFEVISEYNALAYKDANHACPICGIAPITFMNGMRKEIVSLIREVAEEVIGQHALKMNPSGNQNKRTSGNRNFLRKQQRTKLNKLMGDK